VNKPEEMMPEEMDEFDVELGLAMKYVDAPEGFAERVMASAVPTHDDKTVMNGPPRAGKLLAFPRRQVWATGAIAAALIVGAFSVSEVHERREQARVEAKRVEAEREFETASQIEDKTLEHAREQLARAGVKLGE